MASKKTTKKAKASPKRAAKAAPAPKKGRRGPRGPRAGSKTSFILGQPSEMLAKDVVAAGAKAGLEFSDKFVWSVRSAAKSKGAPIVAAPTSAKALPPKRGPGRPKKVAASSSGLGATNGLEEKLFSLALEVGIARAEAIVQRARQQIDGLRLGS